MTQLGTLSPQTRLKRSEGTFLGTLFVRHKTCVRSVPSCDSIRSLTVPTGVEIVRFIECDRQMPEVEQATPGELSLEQLKARYLKTHENGSLEASMLDGIKFHFRHLEPTLGPRFPMQSLGLAELEQHIDNRAKAKGTKGKRLSAVTIRKEIVTLRTAWN